MKVFPVDSIVTKLGEDGLPIYDRPYASADLREVYANFFSNGVFMDDSTSLQVVNATGGMNVYVKAGTCHINGAFGVETEKRTLQLDAASASLDRIDTIVARLDLAIEARSLDLYVLKGAPAEDPVRPNLTRNETVWELGLADVYLPKGIATISQGRISDTRLETRRCGAVAPFVEFDTTTLFEQLKQATRDAVNAMNAALDGTTAGDLKKYRRSLRVETEIPAAADLNNYQTVGNYGCSVAGNVAGIKNKPSGLAKPFLLFVHTVGSAVLQEAIDAVSGSRWCRAGSGAWVQTYDSNSVVPVADGGTGATTLTANAVLLGNGTGVVKQKATASGAMYATGAGAEPSFGTLPIAQGGTGGTSGANALNNLGIKGWLLDNVFKVGYVWISYTDTSPSGLVGGTWTPITGRFPYFNAGTGTGGSNTHTLTVGEMPGHNHATVANGKSGNVSEGAGYTVPVHNDYGSDYSGVTSTEGDGKPHNNMPAYQTLYAWRRTA
nr:MAG: protein of unknown function (DUF859) [Bacteriophage sp.]